MGNLGEVIRSISIQTNEASKPSTRIFGTITSIEPIKVQINEKLVLGTGLLIVTQTIKNYIDCGALGIGDKVILTRQPGGQKYILDDMLASNKDVLGKMILNHIHKYVDSSGANKSTKKTESGKWVN